MAIKFLCVFYFGSLLSFSPFPNKLEQSVLNFITEGFNRVEKKFEDIKQKASLLQSIMNS